MNWTVNIFLLAGDKFMPEMHWIQSGFTYSACGPFTEKKRKNANIYVNKRFTIYLSKWIW